MQNILQWTLIKAGNFTLKSFDFLVDFLVSPKAVFDMKNTELLKLLDDNIDFIQKEYQAIFDNNQLNNIEDFYKVDTEIGQDENWKSFPFKLYNNSFEKNLLLCPNINRLLQSIPSCTSAMISVLCPGKYISPHKGLYKGIIRCLFTIEVPSEGAVWIVIDGKRYDFQRGKAIFFDETYLHEVKNEADGNRVALYLDIYRQLPFPLNLLNRIVFNLLKNSFFITQKVKGYSEISNSRIINQQKLVGYQF
jgi:beta-hydroxylase